MWQSNRWTVNENIVTDPRGNVCIAPRVRIVDDKVFEITHPSLGNLKVDTMIVVRLPNLFIGDLNKLVEIPQVVTARSSQSVKMRLGRKSSNPGKRGTS